MKFENVLIYIIIPICLLTVVLLDYRTTKLEQELEQKLEQVIQKNIELQEIIYTYERLNKALPVLRQIVSPLALAELNALAEQLSQRK